MRLLYKPLDDKEKREMKELLNGNIVRIFLSDDVEEIVSQLGFATERLSMLAYSRVIELQQGIDQMSKEEYYDALQYLYEHAYKCNDCEHINIKCDGCEKDNTMECDIAHYRLTDIVENFFELKEENKKLKIALDDLILKDLYSEGLEEY